MEMNGWVVSLMAVAVMSVLDGCVNYAGIKGNSQMTPATQYEVRRSLPDEGGKWPDLNWAARFGDPELPALIDESLRGNPSINEAQARIHKAASYIESTNSALYPSVNGSYSWTRERFTDNGLVPPPFNGTWQSENNVLAGASWDLDLWGKNRERLKKAVSEERMARAEMQEVRLSLAAAVAEAYVHLAQLYALRDIQTQEVGNREEIGRITHGRVGAGLDTDVEQQLATGETSTTRTSVSELDGQITVVRYQLSALLGQGPDRGLNIRRPLLVDAGNDGLPDNIPADLVSRRPDMVAAYWRVDAALHDVKEAKAEFYPDVNLSAAAGLDAFGWGRFLNASSFQTQFGPAIHLPIFDAGYLRSQLKGRYADLDIDIDTYDKTLIGALSEVATKISEIRSDETQLRDARQALEAQDKGYQLVLGRYRSGLTGQLQVLRADDSRLAAQLTVVNLEMNRRSSQVGLIKALGGGFHAADAGLAVSLGTPNPEGQTAH